MITVTFKIVMLKYCTINVKPKKLTRNYNITDPKKEKAYKKHKLLLIPYENHI